MSVSESVVGRETAWDLRRRPGRPRPLEDPSLRTIVGENVFGCDLRVAEAYRPAPPATSTSIVSVVSSKGNAPRGTTTVTLALPATTCPGALNATS